jgi:long-chain acyl-CoA synthetase
MATNSLVDRVKDLIVTGAENVHSSEVEDALGSHPEVDQVVVIGIPSEKWGEAVHAIVVRVEGSSVEAEELLAHAREHIAGYKVPKSIEFRDGPLPLSGAMKVLKRELRCVSSDPRCRRGRRQISAERWRSCGR